MQILTWLTSVSVIFTIAGYSILAQKSHKIAYVDVAEIIQIMPEYMQAQQELQKFAEQLDNQLNEMLEEYQKKVQEFQENQDIWPDAVKEIKLKELASLEANIQEFRIKAQQDLQIKQQELLQPLIDKIKKAAEEVARTRGYDYVIDSSAGILLVKPPGDDLTPYVKQKLGLQ